ncbi:Aste57867_12672 [Aphanomyces stellatus]|uniref:Aste57867_12672 protein n=1 Tax=Aphanomyces stellatus TaxID=120398 RepID=A0A485KY71_9STRA|nr:hypothetical protein As57867_012625 [Aphanomyces stellatus]VFT89522.1 Aste57867_12672 [Aphanomyces stellatus]
MDDSFHEHIATFYEALAEDKLDQLADALLGLRVSAAAPGNDREASVLQEMLKDCENKALAKGSMALLKLQSLVNTFSVLLMRKSNDDLGVQFERLEAQLRQVINAFYTSYALNHHDTKSMDLLVEFVGLDFKQRAALRVDNLKKQKSAATVNTNGYIDRSIHLEALNSLVHDVSYLVSQVEEMSVPLGPVFQSIHNDMVTGVLDVLALYASDARLMAWEKKVSMRANDAAGSLDPAASSSQVEPDESLQMIDLLLEELACILQLCFHYESYATSIQGSLPGGNSGLSMKVQELNGVYLLMERFYIFQTVHKAVIIAEPQEIEPNVYVISTVEDVSFVLDKAFTRATQSKNYHTVLSIVIAIVEALESIYMPSILDLPRRTFDMPLPVTSPTHQSSSTQDGEDSDMSFSDALLQAVDADLTHQQQVDAKMMMAINSAQMSWDYAGKVHVRIQDIGQEHFGTMPPLLECLPKSLGELQHEFDQVHKSGVRALYERDVHPRFHGRFQQSVLLWQYDLSLEAYDYLEVHGSPVVALVQSMLKDKSVRRFRRGLSSATFETFWRRLVADMCQWIDDGVQLKAFNEVGGMQFEKDVRHLSILCSQYPVHGEMSLRAEFSRLDQIALLVNLAKASDVLDYESIRTHLSRGEIETRLGLRFRSESIQRVMQQLKDTPPASPLAAAASTST